MHQVYPYLSMRLMLWPDAIGMGGGHDDANRTQGKQKLFVWIVSISVSNYYILLIR